MHLNEIHLISNGAADNSENTSTLKIKSHNINKLSIDILTCCIKCHINCLDRCETCGQRYHCDLQKKINYFDFNQFETLFFAS